MADIPAKRIHGLPESPGEFEITDDEQGRAGYIHFACPCGCGAVLGVSLQPAIQSGWTWNGDRDKPTVTPSIKFLGGCQWHGYLTDGVFRDA